MSLLAEVDRTILNITYNDLPRLGLPLMLHSATTIPMEMVDALGHPSSCLLICQVQHPAAARQVQHPRQGALLHCDGKSRFLVPHGGHTVRRTSASRPGLCGQSFKIQDILEESR